MSINDVPNPSRDTLYSPLQPHHTRVVHASLSGDGQLSVELLTIDLSQEKTTLPLYVGVSYTWGDGGRVCSLDVSTRHKASFTIGVTRSAITAIKEILQQVPPGHPLLLWIDQISINQSSESEKAEQIGMMKDIYAKADMVVAWLGYGSEDGDVGMQKINQLFHFMKEKQYLPINGATVDLADLYAVLGSADDPGNMQGWHAVLNILRRPYFHRGWILQEVTAVHFAAAICICAGRAVPLAAFNRIHAFLATLDTVQDIATSLGSFPFLTGNTSLFNPVSSFMYLQGRKDGEALLRLAQRLRSCEITEPRDRLACMLSFATDIHDPESPFQLDYSQQFQHQYTDFATWSIQKYCNLDILSYVGAPHTHNHGLPSWVPDWTETRGSDPFTSKRIQDDLRSLSLFNAGGAFSSDVTVQLPLPPLPTLLNVAGVYLCIVFETKPLFRYRDGHKYTWEWDWSRFVCPLSGLSTDDIFERLRFGDITARFDEANQNMIYARRGTPFPQEAEAALDELLFGQCCQAQALFVVGLLGGDKDSFLLGIGPEGMEVGDQIWMLKGGKTLYVLRPSPLATSATGVVFDATGGDHGVRDLDPEELGFRLVGEALIIGLVDGEVLDTKREPPPHLKDMSQDFESIYLV